MKSIKARTIWGETDKKGASSRELICRLRPAMALVLAALATGCGSSYSHSSVDPPVNPPQLYFSPRMDAGSQATYAVDQTAKTFVRSTYSTGGATITHAGQISTLPNGIVSLAATYIYGGGNGTVTIPQDAPITGSWAVELSGQASLIELTIPSEETSQGVMTSAVNYFTPAVPVSSCPDLTKPAIFQFVTIPRNLNASSSGSKIVPGSWNPNLETAYGSVQIATNGTVFKFTSINQHTMPSGSGGEPGTPSVPAPGNATADCTSTYYGQVISYPGTSAVIGGLVTPTATIGIGPTGFLVEDAGSGMADPATGLQYQNLLGSGYGAIGLLQPSSDLSSSLAGAQYQGFLYAPGNSSSAFSLISSFGSSANQQACATLQGQLTAAQLQPSANTIYGGEFTGNDPASSTLGNCDVAIDLGTESTTGHGLYTGATVYVGSAFPRNGTGSVYSFPAVAVAGQLKGKNAIFIVGADTTGTPSRAWGIYLFQSN